MYFPYLRGKQYELIALREMATVLGDLIVPIIEPVRGVEGSGLERCLSEFAHAGAQGPVVILNPTVGDLANGTVVPEIADLVGRFNGYSLRVGLIMSEYTNVTAIVRDFQASAANGAGLTLIFQAIPEGPLADLQALNPEFAVAPDQRVLQRRIQRELPGVKRVSITDGFSPAPRNSDYLSRSCSVFSEEYLFYKDDGLAGFSDYLTIGAPFNEGGFSPRAVAIHWTYVPQPGDPVMIRHFTSEKLPDEVADVAGKFLEAAEKLTKFMATQESTGATEKLNQHVEKGTYPGLGVVKKLSIQNHLELMTRVMVAS
ncbi:sce7725 family protein [Leucobacter sp. GX24907]